MERNAAFMLPRRMMVAFLQPKARTMQSEVRLALTLTLSPKEREPAMAVLGTSLNGEHSRALENLLPLPGGEGWGALLLN